MSVRIRLSRSVEAIDTIVRIENARSASLTDSVPSAESLRPVNGKVSGPRRHCVFTLMRQTWFTSASMSREIRPGSVPNSATCCP